MGVVVGMREDTRQPSQGQGSTRREEKGHTPTPTTTIRGEEEEGEMGEPATIWNSQTRLSKIVISYYTGGGRRGQSETIGIVDISAG